MSPPREVETTLLIRSARPDRVLRRLLQLEGVPGFRFGAARTGSHRDLYFDTPGRALRLAGVALRMRTRDGERGPEHTLTMKRAGSRSASGRIEREELELPWSSAALARVEARLAELGLEFGGAALPSVATEGLADPAAELHAAELPLECPEGEPFSELRERGLVVVQLRVTQRSARPAFTSSEPGREVVELDLDHVVYPALEPGLEPENQQPVHHHELEVELRSGGTEAELDAVVAGLRAEFGDELQPWPVSKTALGRLFDQLRREHALVALLDATRLQLRPEAYARLLERADGSLEI